jgi:uncharacterized protein with HEPN domain
VTRGDAERLRDIKDAIAAIRSHSASAGEPRLRRDALLYNLVIVGEAVKRLGPETTARHPEIPWKSIAGLRDLLTHEYFRIEMAEIRKIIDRDLGPLGAAVEGLLGHGRG